MPAERKTTPLRLFRLLRVGSLSPFPLPSPAPAGGRGRRSACGCRCGGTGVSLRRDGGCSTDSPPSFARSRSDYSRRSSPDFPLVGRPVRNGCGKIAYGKGLDFARWVACETGESLKRKEKDK